MSKDHKEIDRLLLDIDEVLGISPKTDSDSTERETHDNNNDADQDGANRRIKR